MNVQAVSGQPATPPATDVSDRPDGDLLHIVHSLPVRSGRRAAACEALVLRYKSLVRACARRYAGQPGTGGRTDAGRLRRAAQGDQQLRPGAWRQSGRLRPAMHHRRDQAPLPGQALAGARQAPGAGIAAGGAPGPVPRWPRTWATRPAKPSWPGTFSVTAEDIRDADQADLIFHPHSLDAPGQRGRRVGHAGRAARRGGPAGRAHAGYAGGDHALERAARAGAAASWPCASTAT